MCHESCYVQDVLYPSFIYYLHAREHVTVLDDKKIPYMTRRIVYRKDILDILGYVLCMCRMGEQQDGALCCQDP